MAVKTMSWSGVMRWESSFHELRREVGMVLRASQRIQGVQGAQPEVLVDLAHSFFTDAWRRIR